MLLLARTFVALHECAGSPLCAAPGAALATSSCLSTQAQRSVAEYAVVAVWWHLASAWALWVCVRLQAKLLDRPYEPQLVATLTLAARLSMHVVTSEAAEAISSYEGTCSCWPGRPDLQWPKTLETNLPPLHEPDSPRPPRVDAIRNNLQRPEQILTEAKKQGTVCLGGTEHPAIQEIDYLLRVCGRWREQLT